MAILQPMGDDAPKRAGATAMGAVLILAATVGIIVGATVYFRTDSQLTALVGSFEEDCAAFKRVEGERMSTVMTSFGTYRLMYAAFLVISLVLQFTTKKPYWAGFAVGLLAFAALGLVVDHYAEHRGHVYVDAIDSLQCDDPPSG